MGGVTAVLLLVAAPQIARAHSDHSEDVGSALSEVTEGQVRYLQETWGYDHDDAVAFLDYQMDAAGIASTELRQRPDAFAGAYFDHEAQQPAPLVIQYAVGPSELEEIEAALDRAHAGAAYQVRAEAVSFSQAELLDISATIDEVRWELRDEGHETASWSLIDWENRLDVMVPPSVGVTVFDDRMRAARGPQYGREAAAIHYVEEVPTGELLCRPVEEDLDMRARDPIRVLPSDADGC